jgi:hypothetical protein
MIRAKIGDSLIDFITLNPQKNLAMKSFDLEPRQLQSAIEIGSFKGGMLALARRRRKAAA